jgi:hypothetical protein
VSDDRPDPRCHPCHAAVKEVCRGDYARFRQPILVGLARPRPSARWDATHNHVAVRPADELSAAALVSADSKRAAPSPGGRRRHLEAVRRQAVLSPGAATPVERGDAVAQPHATPLKNPSSVSDGVRGRSSSNSGGSHGAWMRGTVDSNVESLQRQFRAAGKRW